MKKDSLSFQSQIDASSIRRQQILPLGIVVGIGVALLSIFIFLAGQSDRARQSFYKVKGELDLYHKSIWHLEKLDFAQLNQRLSAANTRFPSFDDLRELIGEITDLAKGYEISITSITPSEKTEVRNEENKILSAFYRVPIEMRFRGKYESFAAFLADLSKLEHGVMKADRFYLEKQSAADPNDLLLVLTASVYVRKTAEDEILKKDIPAEISLLERKTGRSRFDEMGRNPFTKAPIRIQQEAAPIALQGIIYDPSQPIALINGETKSVGDVVGDYKIVEIHQDSVLLEKGGKSVKIRLRWD